MRNETCLNSLDTCLTCKYKDVRGTADNLLCNNPHSDRFGLWRDEDSWCEECCPEETGEVPR